jgi:hypothetical protein
MRQCEKCLRTLRYPWTLTLPNGETYFFCSWRCLMEYAAIAYADDQRLAEDVQRHLRSVLGEEPGNVPD